MTVVSLHQSREKPNLAWQKENRRKGIITVKSHSARNDIHMRQHFQKLYVASEEKSPNLKWSLLRCVTLYSNILTMCPLWLYQKLVVITYPRQ